MIVHYKYILTADLPRYEAEGWELCGPMKGKNYNGGHDDTVIVRREIRGEVNGPHPNNQT